MSTSRKSKKKVEVASGNEIKAAVYCVLENSEGARIMEITAATEYLSNISNDMRHLSSMHFAGPLEEAEKLMVLIENKKKSPEGK